MPVLHFTSGPRPDRTGRVLPPDFGSAERQARLDAGLTIKALSELTDVDPRTISAWEKGPREPQSGEVVGALERALGLEEGTLLVRLRGSSRGPSAYEMRQNLSSERLNYVTVSVRQDVHVDAEGRVAHVDTTHRIRALFPGVRTYFLVHAEDAAVERVRVSAVEHCYVGNSRPHSHDRVEVRLELPGEPMDAGEELTFQYRVTHSPLRALGRPGPRDRRHRANGTPTLSRLEMTAFFAIEGCTIRKHTWLNRNADPLPAAGLRLSGTESPTYRWDDPRLDTYGIAWELPA